MQYIEQGVNVLRQAYRGAAVVTNRSANVVDFSDPGLSAAGRAAAGLLGYCRHHEWSGHDPYDALNGRLLRSVGLLRWPLPRLAATQFLKRCPVNLRGLLGVPREQNPKGIAVFLAALVRLESIGLAGEQDVRALAARLLELRSANQARSCWGYNFDWQTRTYLVPRGTPNIVCTTFAANALLDAYDAFGDSTWLEAAQSAGTFLLEGLHRTHDGDTLCFSYTPLVPSQVHNASLLGAALLARLHAYSEIGGMDYKEPSPRPSPIGWERVSRDAGRVSGTVSAIAPTSPSGSCEDFRSAALAATRYALKRQRPDGSWPYGEGAKQRWIDSFHTGFNLMAIERVRQCIGLAECEPAIRNGYRFYLDHFFESDGRAKYFHNRTYPIDAHSIAQALVTLTGLATYDDRSLSVASRVCEWALGNMRAPQGWFYYQKWRWWTNRINYMRWSQAWMLLGLACYVRGQRAEGRGQRSEDRYEYGGG